MKKSPSTKYHPPQPEELVFSLAKTTSRNGHGEIAEWCGQWLSYLNEQYVVEHAWLSIADENGNPVWVTEVPQGVSPNIFPLTKQGRTLGWLHLGGIPDKATSTCILNLLPIMAEGLSRELDQVRTRTASSLIAHLLHSSPDMAEVLPPVLEILSEVLGANTLLMSTRSAFTGENILIAAAGLKKGESAVRLRDEESRLSEAMILEQAKPVWIKDLDNRALVPQPLHKIESLCPKEYAALPLIGHDRPVGILEIFWTEQNAGSYWEKRSLLSSVTSQIAYALERSTEIKALRHASTDKSVQLNSMFESLAHILGLRDHETEAHTQRVSLLTMKLVEHIRLPQEQWGAIRRGALLHDIGKLGIPDSILLKPGSLSSMERRMMELHVTYGHNILSSITNARETLDIVMYHHEHWNGNGYPAKLKGNEIPLTARLFAVVDVFDALTSDRPYRTAWLQSRALEYIKEQSGKQFDPEMVALFLEIAHGNSHS